MNTKFLDALRRRSQAGVIPVIPDIKCISPKYGDLLKGRDPVKAVEMLEKAGAPALSVVTEKKSFGGSISLLESIVSRSSIPVLRKDFIRSVEDLKITKACGADAVLLICAMHQFPMLMELYEQALDMGLEPLVEAHTREELIMTGQLNALLVGINNRNILKLEKDEGNVSSTQQLAKFKPKRALLISESSIQTPSQAQAAIQAGADAVLIGTSIWQADNMVEFYHALSKGIGDCT